jgi:hypothetical protein
MKKRLSQGLLIFFIAGILTFLFYDFVILKLTNIYKAEICLSKYCIQKPHDWLPLVVKKSNKSYLYGEFLKNDMEISDTYFKDESNGILLTKGNRIILLNELTEKKKSKYKLLTQKLISGKIYFIMNSKSFVVVLFNDLNMIFIIDKGHNYEKIVEHLLLTSRQNYP